MTPDVNFWQQLCKNKFFSQNYDNKMGKITENVIFMLGK